MLRSLVGSEMCIRDRYQRRVRGVAICAMSRSASPSRKGKKDKTPEPESSPISREVVSEQMQDIFSMVKALRDEKDALISQLEQMDLRNEADNKRFCKEIGKVIRDLDGLKEIFGTAADGVNAKSAYGIPEVPEAAVAALIPETLHDVMKGDSVLDLGPEVSDVAGEVGRTEDALGDTAAEYSKLAEAGKNLVWDVERLNMIIQAYDKDLAKLKGDGGVMKSRVNALRLMWRSKFSALRRWQDFTRRSHVERFQDQLDEAHDKYKEMQMEKEEDISSLWELIGAQRVKENRVKLTLFLKKMKNAKMYGIWRGWSKFMAKRRKEAMDADKDALFNEHALRMAGKKKEEVEAMLRTFLKRMQARKYVPAFNAWLEIVGGRKKRSFEEQLELERQRRLAAMADMEKSEMAKRLKLHFARLNGKFLDMCWRGWRKFVQDEKLRNLGDDERFKRLKAFLGAKLKGLKYAIFHGLVREAKDNKKMAMMNSDKAKKVACYLEMICRGLTQRIFGAMKRYKFMAKQHREEEERLRALLAEKHSQSLQRLKIFLAGKEKRMLYAGFRWWQNCTVNSKFGILDREIARAQAARKAAEEECERLRAALENSDGKSELQQKLDAILGQKAECQAETDNLTAEIEAAKAKLANLKQLLADAKQGRRDDKLETTRLTGELEKVSADKEDLDKEMALIVDQIGFLSEYSSKKAKN
eukprot:TRINITY_DN7300_c0_g1_i6.p1 TRINITY_DN7300_c0_g1~~TRINITY_DN7300_c0_g1_i6.p1  ORF type:complete len:715 (+),score=322.17 TRINITY_DN7300_c0_g1_i6:46-2145(+)